MNKEEFVYDMNLIYGNLNYLVSHIEDVAKKNYPVFYFVNMYKALENEDYERAYDLVQTFMSFYSLNEIKKKEAKSILRIIDYAKKYVLENSNYADETILDILEDLRVIKDNLESIIKKH